MRLSELEALAKSFGEPVYRGRQIFDWIYSKRVRQVEDMSNIPSSFRSRLAEESFLSVLDPITLQTSKDGTRKALFRLPSGNLIESVLIPELDDDGTAKRLTVCVSSQVGCAMGCAFCATGRMGFLENLSIGQIVDQIHYMNDIATTEYGVRITNVVYMGMGEPLLNYDSVVASVNVIARPEVLDFAPRRVTVSTVGLSRRIRQLADDETRFNLAVSLHAPDDAKRSSIMPVNRAARTDLSALRAAIAYYTQKTGRPVTYEYCMFSGFNDADEDARDLAGVVSWAPSKVNLIMFNAVPGVGFNRTSEDRLHRFIRILVDEGVRVTVRRSRGQDIAAACGQLAASGVDGVPKATA